MIKSSGKEIIELTSNQIKSFAGNSLTVINLNK